MVYILHAHWGHCVCVCMRACVPVHMLGKWRVTVAMAHLTSGRVVTSDVIHSTLDITLKESGKRSKVRWWSNFSYKKNSEEKMHMRKLTHQKMEWKEEKLLRKSQSFSTFILISLEWCSECECGFATLFLRTEVISIQFWDSQNNFLTCS
jgi:hypothetical protein